MKIGMFMKDLSLVDKNLDIILRTSICFGLARVGQQPVNKQVTKDFEGFR